MQRLELTVLGRDWSWSVVRARNQKLGIDTVTVIRLLCIQAKISKTWKATIRQKNGSGNVQVIVYIGYIPVSLYIFALLSSGQKQFRFSQKDRPG